MRNLRIGFIFFLLSFLIPIQLHAGNVLKIGQYQVLPKTEFDVQLEAENDSSFVAFQVDISLPEGFKYMDGSAVLNVSRISGHVLSTSLLTGNILRLIGYSVGNTAFLGNSGALVSFRLKSCTVPATYDLSLSQPMLGNSQSKNILTSSTSGSVTVLAPNIKISTTSIDFGRVQLETTAEQTFQITNEGNSDLTISSLTFNDVQFSTTEVPPFTISPNGSRNITAVYTPTAKGTLAKHLLIGSNDPDQSASIVILNAIAYAVNEVHTGSITGASSSSGKLDFTLNNMEAFTGFQFDLVLPQPMIYTSGSAQLFRSQDHTVSVNQLNSETLRVLVFSSGNKNFTGNSGKVLSLDFSLKGTAGYYPIEIRNVVLANAAGENILSASYNGQLVITSPDIDAPTQLAFGDVSISSTGNQTLRVSNYGQEPLTITQLMFANDYFKSSQLLPVTIQPSAYLDLPVAFAKTTEGAATGTMKIISDDPDENPFSVQLSGNAFTPNYFQIATVGFIQGESKNVSVEIENGEPFVAFQFDLSYPVGLTPDLNAVALTNRKQDHVLSAVALSNTSMRILVYSPGQKTFTGSSGAVLNIPFKAEMSSLPGTYNLTFSNSMMSDANSKSILYAPKNGIVTIQRLNNVPVANAGTDQNINESSTVTLDGSASADPDNDALTYKWTAPKGITLSSTTVAKPTFIAPEVVVNTNYTFSLIVNDGITDSPADQVVITINLITETNSLIDNVDVHIYPNPVIDKLSIEFDGTTASFEIMNLMGQVVYNGNMIKSTIVQTSNLSSGVYMIKFKLGKTFVYKKFIKK